MLEMKEVFFICNLKELSFTRKAELMKLRNSEANIIHCKAWGGKDYFVVQKKTPVSVLSACSLMND